MLNFKKEYMASQESQMVKNLPAMQEIWVLIPGSGKSPGEWNGNPIQYSCLENCMDREAWPATVHGVAKSWMLLSDFHFLFHPSLQQQLYGPRANLCFFDTICWLIVGLSQVAQR